jgi:hypothetical protein
MQHQSIVANRSNDFVAFDNRRVTDTEILEESRAITNLHVRPYGQAGLGHDFVNAHPFRRSVLCNYFLGNVGKQQHPELVVFIPTLYDQAGVADLLHQF